MSKAKKGKSHSEDTNWDEGLINEKIDDELWHPFVMFLVPDNAEANVQLQALENVVKKGNRKKFTYISKKDILLTAQEDIKSTPIGSSGGGKKSKQGSAPTVPRPQHVQVCEHVVNTVSAGEPLSPALTAKMIKYMILKRKAKDIAEKKAIFESDYDLKKGSDDGKKKSGGTSGRVSKAGGKRGKDIPVSDLTTTVAMPTKPPTMMKKRGEMELVSKYLNDEPEPGPSCYFILTGFNSTEMFNYFASIKLKADVLLKIMASKEANPSHSDEDQTKNNDMKGIHKSDKGDGHKGEGHRGNCHKADGHKGEGHKVNNHKGEGHKVDGHKGDGLKVDGHEDIAHKEELNLSLVKFWIEIDKAVQSSFSGSMLRDMARQEMLLKSHTLPEDEVEMKDYSQDIFDEVAQSSYDLLDQHVQYQYYLEYLDIITFTLPQDEPPLPDIPSLDTSIAIETKFDPDRRYYNHLLKKIPEENITVPVIVHAMSEQVSVTTGDSMDSKIPGPSSISNPITEQFSKMIEYLSLSVEDKQLLGVKMEPEVSKNLPDQIIIPYGDQLTKRNIGISNSHAIDFEEGSIKLTALTSFFDLVPRVLPDERARMHALNHLLHAHENFTVPKFNHDLVVLSLESVALQTASTPPNHSFTRPSISPLLLDHPFDLKLVSKETSIVPIGSSTELSHQPASYSLELGKPHCNMESYSVLEVFELTGLLQQLVSLQSTHPYIELFQHKHSESLVIAVHAGFDGSPVHRYDLSSHTHTKVGFQNFLQFVAERYNHRIDEAVEEDEKRMYEYEEEKKAAIALKLKEAGEKQKEGLATVEEEKVKNENGKRTSTKPSAVKTNTPAKKSYVSINNTPTSSSSELPLEANMPPYEKKKKFTGYDMGDTVLLKESVHTTLFTGDGVQVQNTRELMTEGAPVSCNVSLLHNGHKVSCTQVWVPESEDNSMRPGTGTSKSKSVADGIIPQPPSQIKSASFHAQFNDSLNISFSHYGSRADGELPYVPFRPKILDHVSVSDQGLHPSAQLGGVSPKLSKKQQEHQQQMMEQLRTQEAQMEKDRQVAQQKYQLEYDTLVRNNKYQKLFVSTEFGLEVQCHVLINLETEPGSCEGSLIVKQKYAFPDSVAHLNDFVSKEKSRFYHPEGYVIKHMKDDSVIILSADGTKYQSATPKQVNFFLQHKSDANADRTPAELDKTAKRIGSAGKVKIVDSSTEQQMQNKIWAVTMSTGKCYLFQEEAAKAIDRRDSRDASPVPSPSNSIPPGYTTVPLDSIHFIKATDPITKEVYITREDKVILVRRHNNSSYITEFEDGTRFSVSTSQDENENFLPSEVTIECSGFSRVSYSNTTHECNLNFPDNSVVTCSNEGTYTVKKEGDYELWIESNGKALYKIPNATYTLDHTSTDDVFSCIDSHGNTFSLTANGESTIDAPNPIQHSAFEPRYFQLNSDKLVFELQKVSTVDKIIAEAESNPKVALVADSVASNPFISYTTVIEPVFSRTAYPSTLPYLDSSIVPYNLRSNVIQPPLSLPSVVVTDGSKKKPKFGALVGKGLEIRRIKKPTTSTSTEAKPLGFKYRQFLHFPLITSKTKEQIHAVVSTFISNCREHMMKSENMQPTETRDSILINLAEEVRRKFIDSSTGDLVKLYETTVKANERKRSLHPVPPSMSQEGLNFIRQSKIDLEAAEDTRMALRNNTISPYFTSKYVQEYLPIKPPDMMYLTSKLCQPPPMPEAATTKSLSTLQSSSLTLTLDESDSLFVQGDQQSHPSHTITQDTETPTDHRPTNPTPMKAVAADSIRGSLVTDVDDKQENAALDVTGQPREKTVSKPTALLGGRPGEKPNTHYSTVEEPVRRKILTSSAIAVSSKLKGFEVVPEEVDFGVLREGSTYTFKFILKNTGIDLSHFKIKQPPISTGIKVIYNPGPVAAGLTRPVTVELFAMAVGAIGDQGSGQIFHELEIVTQSSYLYLPIRANVLTDLLYDSQQLMPSQGVELTPMGTRKSVTRPLKKY